MTRSPRERFDPPVERCRFEAVAEIARDALAAELAVRAGWTQDRVARMLWHGGLFLDGRPHDATDLPDRIAAGTRIDAHAFAWEPAAIAIGRERILAETDTWLAADKAPWMTTQRSRASARLDFESALRAATCCASLTAVHRLDRETSGVVLFAKTPEAAAGFGRIFAESAAHRRYLAIVSPAPPLRSWERSGFLGRVLDPQRYRFALRDLPEPGFRASHTRFTRVSDDGLPALVACEPTTGRSHQIRVHLAADGTPIVGDVVYGGAPGPRTLLHASELRIRIDGDELVLRAPLPADLSSVTAADAA